MSEREERGEKGEILEWREKRVREGRERRARQPRGVNAWDATAEFRAPSTAQLLYYIASLAHTTERNPPL